MHLGILYLSFTKPFLDGKKYINSPLKFCILSQILQYEYKYIFRLLQANSHFIEKLSRNASKVRFFVWSDLLGKEKLLFLKKSHHYKH